MRRHIHIGSALCALVSLAPCAIETAPRWADRSMPVPDGLGLWLDASRLAGAWSTHGKMLVPDGAIDVWYDASGRARHMGQRVHSAQPRWVSTGDRAVVRFDGKDDFLVVDVGARAAGAAPPQDGSISSALEQFTLFAVVAPRSNPGGFRAIVATHERGKNDYLTGFNLDLSAGGSHRWDRTNVEGPGFGGERNLMRDPAPFNEFQILELTCQPGTHGVKLLLNGREQETRPRTAGQIRMDALFLGARCYSNSPEPPSANGFLDGDIAEILLYERSLSDEERGQVRGYLEKKHSGLTQTIAAGSSRPGRVLKPIDNPPLVQMLAPGFTVRELPIELTNINNVRYRGDGKLFALGYDGNIWLLWDSDGDGLEDRSQKFWHGQGKLRGPIGIALTPPNYKHGQGLFVASKGKLSLIVDGNGDDQADREIVVASGWQEIPQNVDAIGVALAPDGSIYFGLGTANYANGYLIDSAGKAQYDLGSERGTILRVAPDFSRREIVCTGVRFPVALAFNEHGDLFCTDQEGATWLPNGNPFDELLHIRPGRHYGFPPRHPKHLPNVIDEPSVFDYGPQHQSTCGLIFNGRGLAPGQSSATGGARFGPAEWAGDAIVCGESRGKLYRTKLARTPAGYVARSQLFACLNMLTIDACVSPAGDLVVCCHSGPPDWGTGPQGTGKLFKIFYSDRDAPQPVLAWPAGPREVRIAFDRPLDPIRLRNIAAATKVEFGPFVMPGDRFEALKPPYAIVQMQSVTPRQDLQIYAASLSADRRTLSLATAEQAEMAGYALTLPEAIAAAATPDSTAGQIRRMPEIDLGYDLSGVWGEWTAAESASLSGSGAAPADASWSGWLPHIDLDICRSLTAGSAEHDEWSKRLTVPGRLVLRGQLDLWNALRPATQPGATLAHEWDAEEVTVRMDASRPVKVQVPGAKARDGANAGRYFAEFTVTPREFEPASFEIAIETGPEPSRGSREPAARMLAVSFHTREDATERPLPLRRILVPWATLKRGAAAPATARSIPELAGGDWLRGRHVFLSEDAACAKCHRLHGHGGRIGPDLGNLPHRDYASVLRDIVQPSATINPDHISYSLALNDGRVITGVPLTSDERSITIGDAKGQEAVIARAEIEQLKPSELSIMPADVAKQLGPDKLRDLLTYLFTEPLGPAPLVRKDAPPPRRRAEVEAMRRAAEAARPDGPKQPAGPPRPIHIALVAGPKDHGPDEHDYPTWQSRWAKLLALAENVRVSQAGPWPTPEQFKTADVIVLYSSNPAWTADKAAELDAYLARGGGLVVIHYAVNGRQAPQELANRIGLAIGNIKYRHGPLDLVIADRNHPITRGLGGPGESPAIKLVDESYWNMTGDVSKIHVLATSQEDGAATPQVWTLEHPPRGAGDRSGAADRPAARSGRVFVSIIGHYTWTFDDPFFRMLLLRGIAWSGHEWEDRFSELITVGARMSE